MTGTSRMRRLTLTLLAALHWSATVTGAPDLCPGLEGRVPAFVLTAASEGTVVDFAESLAGGGMCAGIVSVGHDVGEVTQPWRMKPKEPAVPLAAAVEAFRRRHGAFHVIARGDFLLLSDRAEDSWPKALVKPVGAFEADGLRSVNALRTIVQANNPAEAETGGVVGSILGTPGAPVPGDDDLLGPPVSLRVASDATLGLLVAIGAKSPGVVWVVTTAAEGQPPGFVTLLAISRAGIRHGLGSWR